MDSFDVVAYALRSPSTGGALNVVMFQPGFAALVCYRLAHRLHNLNRTGLAKFLQSIMSSKFQVDIHPGATIGGGIYLSAGAGVVIGETAVVEDNCSILQGVTLGGTGKNRGDRHPKLGRGVIVQDSATVLGNIRIGDGAVITAKSIVLKEVPDFARVSGIPAKVRSYRFNNVITNSTSGISTSSSMWDKTVEDAIQLWEGTNDDWFEVAGLLDLSPVEEETLKVDLKQAFEKWSDRF